MVEHMLEGIEVKLEINYLEHKKEYENIASKILYTGPIDEYFGYCFGELEYRSLRFETEILEIENYQGVAGMNYTDSETPYTRIIEHKHFEFGTGNQKKTIITREYPSLWKQGDEPYYPINDKRNMELYKRYEREGQKQENVIFAGRLGTYQYYDMDKVIASVLELAEKI